MMLFTHKLSFFSRVRKTLSLPIGRLKPTLAIWPSGFYFPSRPNLTHMKSSMISISYQDQSYDQRSFCSEIPSQAPVTSTLEPSYNLIHDMFLLLNTDESTLCPASLHLHQLREAPLLISQ